MQMTEAMDVVPAERDAPSLALPRTWRCVGLYCCQDAPLRPYLIMTSIFRDTTRNGRDHVLAVRVSATSWLASLVYCPLFEHQCILTIDPTKGTEQPYVVEAIHGVPEFSPVLFRKTEAAKPKKHNQSTEADYLKARQANLSVDAPYRVLSEIYGTCFVIMGGGWIDDWQPSYMSQPIKCRKVRSYDEDPLGKWQRRDDLMTNKYNDTLDVFGPHYICIPVTVDKLWKQTRRMYRLDEQLIDKAVRDLVIYRDVGNTGKVYTGEQWSRDTRDAKRGSHAEPLVKLVNLLSALEEDKHAGILGTRALLCVSNPIRLWAPKAILSDFNVSRDSDAPVASVGIVPPLPWFAIETTRQAESLLKMITATTWDELPDMKAIILLLCRGAAHLAQRPRGACGIVDEIVRKPDGGRFCIEVTAVFISQYCVRQFHRYGSTACKLSLDDLLNKPGVMAEVLGPNVTLARLMCGDGSVYPPPSALSLATFLVETSKKLGKETRLPVFLVPLKREMSQDFLRGIDWAPVPIDGTLWCLQSGRVFADEQELVTVANAMAQKLELWPLGLTAGGGTGMLTPVVTLIRETSLSTLLVVTPYSRRRRAGHLCALLGAIGKQRETSAIGEAIVGLRDLHGTGISARIYASRVVCVDSAHFFSVSELREIITFANHTLRCERLVLIGSTRLVPMSTAMSGAAFRDLVSALRNRCNPELQSLVVSERKVSEADALTIAIQQWKSFSGEVVLRFANDRPTEGTVQYLIPNNQKSLPRSVDASRYKRTRDVLVDARAGEHDIGNDVALAYALSWSTIGWLERGELLTLLSLGHPVIIYREHVAPKSVRGVNFPGLPFTDETPVLVLRELYKNQKFGSFRTTGYGLHANMLNDF